MPIGGLGVVLVLLVGLWLPFLAWKSARAIASKEFPITRKQLFVQVVGLHVFLLILAWLAALENDINLFHAPADPLRAWGAAALLLGVMLATLRLRWKSKRPDAKRRLYAMLPHNGRELIGFSFVSLSAGVAEEVVYRGVMTMLLERLIGNFAVAALASAVVFALAHAIQGWRAVGAVFVIALAAQALVVFAGSLIPAMAVHALYDFVAGIVVPRWYERDASTSAPLGGAEAVGQ